MKARLIENIDFKRGQDTRSALDIGGIIPRELHTELFAEATKKWAEFKQSLIGKTITATTVIHNSDSKSDARTFRVGDVQVGSSGQPWIKFQPENSITWYDIDPQEKVIIHSKDKVIGESIDFKRGMGTKEALELGGFKPEDVYNELRMSTDAAYMKTLTEFMLNKTLKFTGSAWSNKGHEWEEYKIIVKDIHHRSAGSEFEVEDENGERYTVLSSKNIHVS
jgi:hypothetical protein